MLRLSVATFLERWPLFIGAMLTVALGVALEQSSLLILISAATPDIPPGLTPTAEAELREAYVGAVSLLGITLGIAYVLSIVIVSSTFGFTVAQRRRDLALMRLVGGSRGQLRRLLLSEGLLLAVVGSALGVPLGLVAQQVQTWLLVELELVPAGFSARWQPWILAVSFGVGIGVALMGVLAASQRAASVQPLEALRDTGRAARVMTASRWLTGLVFLGGATAMAIVSANTPGDAAVALSANTALVAAIGLGALSPLIVPLFARLLGVVLRGTALGELAEANVRDGVRRTAATAGPLILLAGLIVGLTGTLFSLSEGIRVEQARDIDGDLVVESTGTAAERIAELPGVALASPETSVQVTVTQRYPDGEGGEDIERLDESFLAVDPATYQAVHQRSPVQGSLDGLEGEAAAVERGFYDLGLGDEIEASVAGRPVSLRIVAVNPSTLSYDGQLLPRALFPPDVLAGLPTRTVVQVAPRADASTVGQEIQAAGLGEVFTVAEAVAVANAEQENLNWRISAVILGLSGLFALIAVVNSVVIATSQRSTEFAVARVSGLGRGQVLWTALVESWVVTTVALLLAALAAATSLLGVRSAIENTVGVPVVAVPWSLAAVVTVGSFLVVGVTTLLTAYAATRPRPVTLVTARE